MIYKKILIMSLAIFAVFSGIPSPSLFAQMGGGSTGSAGTGSPSGNSAGISNSAGNGAVGGSGNPAVSAPQDTTGVYSHPSSSRTKSLTGSPNAADVTAPKTPNQSPRPRY